MKKRNILFFVVVMLAAQAHAAASMECFINVNCDGQDQPREGRGMSAQSPFAERGSDGIPKCTLSANDKAYCNATCTKQKKRVSDCSAMYHPQPQQMPSRNP